MNPEEERDELRAVLRDLRGTLRGAMLIIDAALAPSAEDAVVSPPMECVHPADRRVPVGTMGGISSFICLACKQEVEG